MLVLLPLSTVVLARQPFLGYDGIPTWFYLEILPSKG